MNRDTPKSNKSENNFLGINFTNFFKSCGGCCAGERDDISVSSQGGENAIKRQKQQQGAMVQEGYQQQFNEPVSEHSASAQDWADFDEFIYPVDPSLKVPDVYEADPNDVCPQEPLDMDYLRQLSKESSDGENPTSDISGHSKKIGKNKPDTKVVKNKKKEVEAAETKNRNKRRPWQPHEDAKVLEMVGKYGQSWALISSMLEGRTGKQVRDRFLNKLRPNIKKGDWSQAEDQLLLSIYYQIGHKWSKIATYLPGRTEGQVKNRFYSHIKKKILKDDLTSEPHETQTSPMHMKQEASPERGQTGNFQLNQVTFGGNFIEQSTSPMSYSTNQTQKVEVHPVQQDAGDFISYQNGHGYQQNNQPQFNGAYSESMSSPESYVNYNPKQEKEFDDVLFRATNYYEASTSGQTDTRSVAGSDHQSDMNNMEKLERMDLLSKRKKNLEYLLHKTMQDIQNYTPAQLQQMQNGGYN
jgi:hypothetical protein